MSFKLKIFNTAKNIKFKLKTLLRKISYSNSFQEIISGIVFLYAFLVYLTSEKKFINKEVLLNIAHHRSSVIVAFWHNRLMMIPFLARKIKQTYPNYNFMTLASKHGDGRLVGRVMSKFGLISILGSKKNIKQSSRGIDFSSTRQIVDGLKRGYSLGITPDGPRGPNQKINGDLINLARITQTKILAISYSCLRYKTINSWDHFKIPLPFNKICFYLDEEIIEIPSKIDDQQINEYNKILEEKLNDVQKKSEENILL